MGSLDHIEEHTTIGDIDGRTAQLLVERGIMEQIEITEQQQTGRLLVGIKRQQRPQLIERVAVKAFWVIDQFYYLHLFTFSPLPIGYGSVEYLVTDVFDHLGDEFLLHGIKRLRGFITLHSRELLFKILGVVHVVGKPDVNRH